MRNEKREKSRGTKKREYVERRKKQREEKKRKSIER